MATRSTRTTAHDRSRPTPSLAGSEDDAIAQVAERYETARAQMRFEEIASCEGIVTVYFTRRTTTENGRAGEERRMMCLYDPRAPEGGEGYTYAEHGLMPVLDVEAGERGELRTIPLDGVHKVMHRGEVVYQKEQRDEQSLEELDEEMKDLF
jgi:hypothetical protein